MGTCGTTTGLTSTQHHAAGIAEYEQVHCVNKANGNRWVTYAIAGPEGQCCLNGAAARQGEIGDELLIFTYRQEHRFSGATVLYLNERNEVERTGKYEPAA